jgi:hypothetical protein
MKVYHQERLQPEASSFAAGHDRPHPLSRPTLTPPPGSHRRLSNGLLD